jgi:hypothetical protein
MPQVTAIRQSEAKLFKLRFHGGAVDIFLNWNIYWWVIFLRRQPLYCCILNLSSAPTVHTDYSTFDFVEVKKKLYKKTILTPEMAILYNAEEPETNDTEDDNIAQEQPHHQQQHDRINGRHGNSNEEEVYIRVLPTRKKVH